MKLRSYDGRPIMLSLYHDLNEPDRLIFNKYLLIKMCRREVEPIISQLLAMCVKVVPAPFIDLILSLSIRHLSITNRRPVLTTTYLPTYLPTHLPTYPPRPPSSLCTKHRALFNVGAFPVAILINTLRMTLELHTKNLPMLEL